MSLKAFPKNPYREICLLQAFGSSLCGVSSDAPRCIGLCSTLHRLFLHVYFPLSTFTFPLHSLFRLTALCAVPTLS